MEVEVPLILTTAVCPGCRAALHRVDASLAVIAPCMQCGGVWLDRAAGVQLMDGSLSLECKALIRQHGARAADDVGNGGYRERPTGLERACPMCGKGLQEARTGDGPALDVCEHGTFFDRGELRAIHEAVTAKLNADEEEYEALAAAQWHTRLYGWIYGEDFYGQKNRRR
jgi:Zn-finger nucleic acid-binding protein